MPVSSSHRESLSICIDSATEDAKAKEGMATQEGVNK